MKFLVFICPIFSPEDNLTPEQVHEIGLNHESLSRANP